MFRLFCLTITALWLSACSVLSPAATPTATQPPTHTPTLPPPSVTPLPTTTATPEPTATPIPLGAPENPLLFIYYPVNPSQDAGFVTALQAQLQTAGLSVQMQALSAQPSQELCAAPDKTFAILPAEVAAQINSTCPLTATHSARQLGVPYRAGMVLVSKFSPIVSLSDLQDKKWAVSDANAYVSVALVQGMFQQAHLQPAALYDFGDSILALQAVFRGEFDFTSGYFVPPLLADGATEWDATLPNPDNLQSAEPTTGGTCLPSGLLPNLQGVQCGAEVARDERVQWLSSASNVFSQTRIVAISPPIPNDVLVFGADVPAAVQSAVATALLAYANDPTACAESLCNASFYAWEGLDVLSASWWQNLLSMRSAQP
ncbi:MAG TPA: PhnD/SsuA/transferrin family substrate-binding protein [Anaerolineales bacterium]|nr:PhnD/SsuA/transferrin family substrate-binding protein [Anaerolineales bacterium]